MSELILHHYDISPFSEKVRVVMGIKGLAWRSVIPPVIMPKPDLIPLTGGYRRIPVLQIEADIYCDSQLILEELDLRFPDPRVARGADRAVNLWADRPWFMASRTIVFGEIGPSITREFIADREKLSGRPFDLSAIRAAVPFMRTQWRAYAAWLEEGLAADDYLGGSKPSLADVAAWLNVWWVSTATPGIAVELLGGLSRTRAWCERIRSIGHGQRTEMAAADALRVAALASPGRNYDSDPCDPSGLKPGDHVIAQTEDGGDELAAGTLIAVAANRVTLARSSSELGTLHVHFPRVGYRIERA